MIKRLRNSALSRSATGAALLLFELPQEKTNNVVFEQVQHKPGDSEKLEIADLRRRGIVYFPSSHSENKGADQLCGYRKADLRLCFRLSKLLVFSVGGSFVGLHYRLWMKNI